MNLHNLDDIIALFKDNLSSTDRVVDQKKMFTANELAEGMQLLRVSPVRRQEVRCISPIKVVSVSFYSFQLLSLFLNNCFKYNNEHSFIHLYCL